jgi:DNA-binding transcriptional regulator LsrR (DeoR family)
MLDRARRVGLVSINLNTEYLDAFELSGELRRAFGLAEALVVPDHEKEPFDHHAMNARVGLGGADNREPAAPTRRRSRRWHTP